MLALWTTVTRFRPCVLAYSNANVATRVRRSRGNDLQTLDDAWNDLVLQARVQVLGVLADDHQVHAVVPGLHRRNVPDRPQVDEQVERLAQPDVDAGESAADRRRHRSLQGDLVTADRIEQLRRQRVAVLLEREHAGQVRFPLGLETGAVENPDNGRRDLGADAVAGNERDGVGHWPWSRASQYSSASAPAIFAIIRRVES